MFDVDIALIHLAALKRNTAFSSIVDVHVKQASTIAPAPDYLDELEITNSGIWVLECLSL